jgi:rare lipoprotein A (peptidoglycan hydrolase)
MKRLAITVLFGLLIVSVSFAQTQTGNASYNPSKTGLTISHPSLSFNTRVRVTNLSNSQSVEAVVNGRIPVESGRITDVSRETGDALGMSKSGLTPVRIEILPLYENAAAEPPAVVPAAETAAAPVSGTTVPPPTVPPAATDPQPVQVLPPATSAEQTQQVKTITEIQYVPVQDQDQFRPCSGILLLLLIIIILLLIIIIILLIRIIKLMRRSPSPPEG